MSSIYIINKGINRPVVFRGLKAQYIWFLAAALLVLLIVFAVLYICGVHAYVSLGIVFVLGGVITRYIYHLSNKYGQYGMMKKIAGKRIPTTIKTFSRKEFFQLKK